MVRPGVKRYVVVPLLINVVAFAGAIYWGKGWVDAMLDRWLPDWLEWLAWILIPLFLLSALVVVFFTFNLVANLVSAPFNGLLAEAVERDLTGRAPADGGWAKLARDLGLTIVSELRKLVYIALRTVPLAVLALLPIPGLNLLATLAWLALSAWMLAIAYADYPMANHGLGFPEQRRRLGEKRFLSLGFGGCIMVALAVPVLNFLVIPCAVAGATAMWVEQLAPPTSTDVAT